MTPIQTQPSDLQVLERVLQEESKLYSALTACLERQRDALVGLEKDRLGAISLELESLVSDVKGVSEARSVMVSRLAAPLGRKGESLRDLAEAAPEPHRARFAALRRELLDKIKGMERVAGLCQVLAQDGMGRVNAFVKILAGLSGPSPVYALPRTSQGASLVDRTA